MRFRSGLIIAIVIAISGSSCKQKGVKNINQGEIHYAIEYLGNSSIMPREIMPKNLVVSFKDNKILFDISAPFGNSGILNLANPEKGIYDTYISLLSWKFYYPAKLGEPYPGFDSMKGMEIRKTSRTSVICGFNCKSAEVSFPENSDRVFEIWYTNEIRVKDPNASTPFSEIDGILMKFFFIIGPMELHFDAETVYKKDIPDKTFERREKFSRLSKEDINLFIEKMINL